MCAVTCYNFRCHQGESTDTSSNLPLEDRQETAGTAGKTADQAVVESVSTWMEVVGVVCFIASTAMQLEAVCLVS